MQYGVTEHVDIDRVSRLLFDVAAEEVLPRFGKLAASEVERKHTDGDPDDIVSAADRAVERGLGSALAAMLPGSNLVGEEAVHADPRLCEALRGDGWVWVVDPIDGTRNFVRGHDGFGIMVALVRAARTRAAWILLPVRRRLFVAEEGGGAYADGERLRAPSDDEADGEAAPRRGCVFSTFMPEELRRRVERQCAGRFVEEASGGCSAVDYTSVAQGRPDFLVYYRLLPWDHAPAALIVREAGGVCVHPDGRSYGPLDPNETTIVARSARVAADVRGWMREGPR
jgi:fructose-1,6-bisphosphatase/inositol monophosphatase family enzyme